MKFTEGYWLRSENMAPSYASQGFYAEKTERGMRIVAPERKILGRGDAQNITTISLRSADSGISVISAGGSSRALCSRRRTISPSAMSLIWSPNFP